MYSGILKHILVPVDLGANTVFSVKQSIELMMTTGAVMHLLHVIETPEHRNEDTNLEDEGLHTKEILKKLSQWKSSIEETVPGSKVRIHIAEGSVNDNILDFAKKIQPQLIILGKIRPKGFLNIFRPVPLCPNEISLQSHCPVLTILNKPASSRTQNIVVPIRSFIPKRKIQLLLVFARMYRAKIHLIALDSNMGENDAERIALLDTFQLLKNGLINSVEYHLLGGHNLPKATLKYAETIHADMVFVNPCAETRTSVFMGKHINELMPSTSGVKFLFVDPYPEGKAVLH